MDWLKETIDEHRVKAAEREKAEAEKKKLQASQKEERRIEAKEKLLQIKDEFEKVKAYLVDENFPCIIELNNKPENEIDIEEIKSVSLTCDTKLPFANNPFCSYDGSSISFTVDYNYKEYKISIRYNREPSTDFQKPAKNLQIEYIKDEIKKFIKNIYK